MIEFLEAAACKISSWLFGLGQANRLQGYHCFERGNVGKKKIEDILIF